MTSDSGDQDASASFAPNAGNAIDLRYRENG